MATQPTKKTKNKKAQRISSPFAKRLYTLKEAGQYLARSEYSIRSLIWAGLLPVVKHGRKQWVDLNDMDTYIKRNKETMV